MKIRNRPRCLSSTLLMGVSALSIIAGSSQALAQNEYLWTMGVTDTEWGSWNTTGGTYTRDSALTGGGVGGSSGLANNEAPVDGQAGIIGYRGNWGVYTRTDPNAVFDLSVVGSKATIQSVMWYNDLTDDTGGDALLWEFGLTSNADYFGASTDDSVFLGATYDLPFTWLGANTLDVHLFTDETSDSTPTDGNWSVSPLETLATDIDYQAIGRTGSASALFQPGIGTLVEVSYTNLGGGQMEIDYAFTEIGASGPTSSDTVTSVGTPVTGSTQIAHNLSSGSLGALRPGFGVRQNDSLNPYSGGAFDWTDDFNQLVVLPEPSSCFLILTAGMMLLLRRKRRG